MASPKHGAIRVFLPAATLLVSPRKPGAHSRSGRWTRARRTHSPVEQLPFIWAKLLHELAMPCQAARSRSFPASDRMEPDFRSGYALHRAARWCSRNLERQGLKSCPEGPLRRQSKTVKTAVTTARSNGPVSSGSSVVQRINIDACSAARLV